MADNKIVTLSLSAVVVIIILVGAFFPIVGGLTEPTVNYTVGDTATPSTGTITLGTHNGVQVTGGTYSSASATTVVCGGYTATQTATGWSVALTSTPATAVYTTTSNVITMSHVDNKTTVDGKVFDDSTTTTSITVTNATTTTFKFVDTTISELNSIVKLLVPLIGVLLVLAMFVIIAKNVKG